MAMDATGEATVCQAQMRGLAKGFPKFNGQTVTIETHSAEEIMNSTLHKSVRLAQFEGRWHENCENCMLKEKASDDMKFRIAGSMQDIKDCLHNMEADGTMKQTEIHRIEVRFSNQCNAACVHCSPVASTMWYDEYYGFFGEAFGHTSGGRRWILGPDEHDRIRPVEFRDVKKTSGLWKTLEDHKGTINYVILSGGEPMIMPEHGKLLDFFIDNGRAEHVVLFYHTNLSVINPGIINKWSHFKDVRLSVSMDEIEDRYEFIRHPLKWDRLQKNIQQLKEHDINIHGASICCMIPNMLRMDKIDDWFSQGEHKRSFLFVHGSQGSRHLNINILPVEARRELIDINRSIGKPLNIETARWIEEQIDQPGEPEMCDQLIRFLDYLDKTRNKDWKVQLPEVYEFLKKYDIG